MLDSSGYGFVNFGVMHDLPLEVPIETFGPGACSFNVYFGTTDRVEFDRIVTHAEAAVGVQTIQPIGTMIVNRGIETFAGQGPWLVKGVIQNLPAILLSIKQGRSAKLIQIEEGLQAHHDRIIALEMEGSAGESTHSSRSQPFGPLAVS